MGCVKRGEAGKSTALKPADLELSAGASRRKSADAPFVIRMRVPDEAGAL